MILEPLGADASREDRDHHDKAGELRSLYATDAAAREVIDMARGLENLRRQDSIHAAAVVIAPSPLTELVPVQRKGEEAEVVTQYEMKGVASLGLLKMDFLGLRNLSIIERTLELIREGLGIEVDIDQQGFDDPAVYELLRRGDTVGVFQLEGSGLRSLARSAGTLPAGYIRNHGLPGASDAGRSGDGRLLHGGSRRSPQRHGQESQSKDGCAAGHVHRRVRREGVSA
jgi:DNA polymerase III alpha subunit